MTALKIGERVMNGTNQNDYGYVLEVRDDVNGPVLVEWRSGETAWCGADCVNSLDNGAWKELDPDRLREDRVERQRS